MYVERGAVFKKAKLFPNKIKYAKFLEYMYSNLQYEKLKKD